MFLKNNKYIKYSIYLLLLLLINFFFYSLISIAIYKIICNETNYFNLLENEILINKLHNIYYFNETINIFYIIDYSWYNLETLGTFFNYFNGVSNKIFYFILKELYIESYSFTCLSYIINELLIIKYNNLDIMHLTFFIRSSNLNIVNALSLQKMLIVNINETSLFFFRIYNPTHLKLELITLYVVYPNEMSLYVNKIQCFCFNVLFIYPLEIIDLPVLIYILSYIPYLFIFNINLVNHLIIYYIIFLH